MKKTYIIPTAKSIVFSTEENVLSATSLQIKNEEGVVNGGMSNHRGASESIWGEEN